MRTFKLGAELGSCCGGQVEMSMDPIEGVVPCLIIGGGHVGSRAKAERTRQRREAKGFAEEGRARVRMPVGVDIGAGLPDEIAVSIAPVLVAWKKKGASGGRSA